jgi:disulfide oxidoreductase YuzD
MTLKSKDIKWLLEPEEHDYPAALSYLRLIYDDIKSNTLVEALKGAPMTEFKSKDIFRASRLPLLGISNSHVEKNMKKLEDGKLLSPLLLVRDSDNGILIIADGYHRLCTIYTMNEDAIIPAKIV